MNKRIEKLVSYYKRKYSTNDPFRLAEHLGIKVFYQPLGKVAGSYKYIKHTRCIFINSDITDDAFLRVVMAHELGHAIMHQKENCCYMARHTFFLASRLEIEANEFTAHLLIDNNMLSEAKERELTLEQFAMEFGIEKNIVELKLSSFKEQN